jgi:two-component system chemotaxis response regulator CheB
VGRAQDGAALLALPQRKIAHVAIVDVLMPGVAGLSLIRRLTEDCEVIVVSSMANDSGVAKEALALGASAFFCKKHLADPVVAQQLRDAVKHGARLAKPRAHGSVVFIVGSTGAVVPLETLAQELEPLNVPVLVVQHLPEGKAEGLAQLLCSRGARAQVARQGDVLEARVFVAPIGRHMELDAGERIRLVEGRGESRHCPSGDVLLESAVRLGSRAIAVILSGLGTDGARGVKALAESGATCLAQRPEDCVAAYMPLAALAASRLVRSVSLPFLGHAICRAIQSA